MSRARQISGYRIIEQIGTGAASVLYAVQHPKTKQVWALKHVVRNSDKDQRFIDQAETEHQVGSRLRHPAIRRVDRLIKHRRFLRTEGVSLIMELVDGLPLDNPKRQPKSLIQAVRIFQQVAEGLSYMHTAGYVHADIKPANIMVGDKDRVKLIDLGQACQVGTVKKRIQGTPGYMAPEQAHRQAITPRTDIYNFGATMYWVLLKEVIPTALPPKDDSNSLYSGALDAEQVDRPVPPAEKDPRIHPLLSKQILDCVQLHPGDRPDSMEFVANRLELIGDLLENPPSIPPLREDGETAY